MSFTYRISGPIHTSIIESPGDWAYEGQAQAPSPRSAVEEAITKHANYLDVDFDLRGPLAPVISLARNSDGTFTAEVETHGLGDLQIELEQVTA